MIVSRLVLYVFHQSYFFVDNAYFSVFVFGYYKDETLLNKGRNKAYAICIRAGYLSSKEHMRPGARAYDHACII